MSGIIEAFDKATGLLKQERDRYEDAAVTAYYHSLELQRLLVQASQELAKTPAFQDWISTTNLVDWAQLKENELFKECGEDVVLVAKWLEAKGNVV